LDIVTVDLGGAACGFYESTENADGCCFSRSVWSQKTKKFSFGYLEAQVFGCYFDFIFFLIFLLLILIRSFWSLKDEVEFGNLV